MITGAITDATLLVFVEITRCRSVTISQAVKAKSFLLDSFKMIWNCQRSEIWTGPKSMR